jgi:hypothetical protein
MTEAISTYIPPLDLPALPDVLFIQINNFID